jgi:hypothetical protein
MCTKAFLDTAAVPTVSATQPLPLIPVPHNPWSRSTPPESRVQPPNDTSQFCLEGNRNSRVTSTSTNTKDSFKKDSSMALMSSFAERL